MGCVAKPGGSLVEIAFILTTTRQRHLSHDSIALVRTLCKGGGNPPTGKQSPTEGHRRGCLTARKCPLKWRHFQSDIIVLLFVGCASYAPELNKRCQVHLRPTMILGGLTRRISRLRESGNICIGLWILRATPPLFMLSAFRDARAAERFFLKIKYKHYSKLKV